MVYFLIRLEKSGMPALKSAGCAGMEEYYGKEVHRRHGGRGLFVRIRIMSELTVQFL